MKLRLPLTLFLALALLLVGFDSAASYAQPARAPQPALARTPATPGAWPWTARISRSGPTGLYCGGSLIATQWVLTAAHCIQGSLAGYTIVLGDHSRTVTESSEQIRTVSQIVVHPSYSSSTYNNDLALFRLSSPVTINTRVQTVTLEINNANLVAGTSATLTGWGSSSPLLQQAAVTIISNATCSAAYGSAVPSSVLCGSTQDPSLCQGNTGGPLVVFKNGIWRQGGILSWGYACANPSYPDVYTRVPSFITWIRQYVPA